MPGEWVTTADLANLADVSERKARQALQRILNGRVTTWRGAALVVRQVPGRGGRSGLHYEVLVSSLPDGLQEELRQHQVKEPLTLRHDPTANDLRTWWATVLAPAIVQPKQSSARAQAIADIAAREHVMPDGTQATLNKRTIRRHIANFEKHGVAGLQKSARRDKGQRRVLISELWDETVPFDSAERERIAARCTDHVRGLWRSGAVLSMVIRNGSEDLMKATKAAGHDPGDQELRRICELPRRFVEPHKHLRKAHRYERDRKAHEDAKPRIRRTRDGLSPMEVVVGDVHHLDIIIARDDGTMATPKMIAWLDFATMRVFSTFELCQLSPRTGRSEGIRNEHVIASFIAMTQHPEWGMPRILYLDNGSEYNFAPFIDDAMKLVANDGLTRMSQNIRAKPYNAPAKAIEGVFGVLERNYFNQVPGWIGGDRMKQKTANVGRAPAPFPGVMRELEQVLQAYLTVYETQPQRGGLNGRSPREAFTAAINNGWQRTDVDPFALRVAFSAEEGRTVRQGSIEVRGQRWTCDELQAYLGDRVTVLVPKYEDWSSLPLKDDQGKWLGNAVRDVAFNALDPEGAREASRRSHRYERAVRNVARAVPRRDLVGEAIASAALAPPAPVAPSAGVISLSDEAAAMGRAINETPKQRREREQASVEAEQKDSLQRSEKSLEAARRAAKKRAG